MSEYVPQENVLKIFEELNLSGINYVLLRNLKDELPGNLKYNKDIDIMVNVGDVSLLHSISKKFNWKKLNHPFGNVPFLYGMQPFEFYQAHGINIDICFQLSCRSLNKGEWFPLDMYVQESDGENQLKTNNKPWKYTLSNVDEMVHLLTRSLFDKKAFGDGYIERLNELQAIVDEDELRARLKLIFFQFTDSLITDIKNRDYENIYRKYIQFRNY